jgi:pSer/pThr/pTyr-binding forkhead associated (FHA) protein
MPVIKVNDQQFSLRPGPNRLGAGDGVDVRVDDDGDGDGDGIQAIVEVANDSRAVIRPAGRAAAVRVNGVPLVDPTPLIHGDKLEIAGHELYYTDDSKAGATQYISAESVAAIAKRTGPPRATASTGGRLVSLVDGKEYTIGDGGITIGRDATSDVVVAQNDVSRNHAEIVPVTRGYELRDFSANGVLVNGERIDGAQLLSRADVIRVGSEEFRFYADLAQPAPQAAAPPPPAAARAVPPEIPAGPRPVLAVLEVINEGLTKGTTYDVRVPLAHIGRGAHNDVIIADDSVSDTHAKLQHRDDGWYLVDVGSTNGTFVGGHRIPGERRLDGTPDVRFGGVKLIFRPKSTAEAPKGTRAIGSIDRAPIHPAAAPAPQHTVSVAEPSPRSGLPGWVWAVVALAIAAVAAFLLLNR